MQRGVVGGLITNINDTIINPATHMLHALCSTNDMFYISGHMEQSV